MIVRENRAEILALKIAISACRTLPTSDFKRSMKSSLSNPELSRRVVNSALYHYVDHGECYRTIWPRVVKLGCDDIWRGRFCASVERQILQSCLLRCRRNKDDSDISKSILQDTARCTLYFHLVFHNALCQKKGGRG